MQGLKGLESVEFTGGSKSAVTRQLNTWQQERRADGWFVSIAQRRDFEPDINSKWQYRSVVYYQLCELEAESAEVS